MVLPGSAFRLAWRAVNHPGSLRGSDTVHGTRVGRSRFRRIVLSNVYLVIVSGRVVLWRLPRRYSMWRSAGGAMVGGRALRWLCPAGGQGSCRVSAA